MGPERAVERRIVSVLFADIVGFTALSEHLDPEDVASVQEAYFAAVREVITRYGGRLEKFIGDAAMAVFGLPSARDDDAERAVRAGLALIAAVEHLGARLGIGTAPLELRVGVNTGEVVATEAEGDDWRVTGDTVNTAARLQTASRPGRVMVGELTALTVEDAVELEPPVPLDLKGKAAPVRARLVVGLQPDRSRERAMGSLHARTLGREAELATLVAAAASLAPPRRTARWLVVAPPGVGKSRLLAELAERLGPRVCVLRTQLRPEAEAPFAGIAQLARDALAWGVGPVADDGGSPDLGQIAAALRGGGATPARAEILARELGALLESGGAEAGTPGGSRPADRSARFAAWIEAFDFLACNVTSTWFLEDLHWAGPDLLAFVDQVHATPAPHGRLVVGTARPSLLEREPGWCGPRDDEALHRLDLEPLPAQSARELVAALLGGDCLPQPLVERIAARSDGNPLFIEELLRTWISVGTLVIDPASGCTLANPERAVDLPGTVQAIYAGQLDDLPPDARLLARRASVAGRSFPADALPTLGAPAGEALEGLRLRRLVHGPDPSDLGPSYAYRHALLRDAGYATLARVERAHLHVRLARWMTEAAGSGVDRLAEGIALHYESAVNELPVLAGALGTAPTDESLDRERLASTAAGWLQRAASVALRATAQANARDLTARALALTPPGASLERGERLMLLAEATAFSGDMDAGVVAYRDAAEVHGALLTAPDPETAAGARDGYAAAVLGHGTLLVEQLQFRDAQRLADAALARIGPKDDLATGRLRYLRAWAQVAYQPRPESADDARAAIAAAERAGDEVLRLEALYLLQSITADSGTVSRAELLAQTEEIADLALDVGSMRRATVALRARGLFQAEVAPDEGRGWVERSLELADAHGLLEDRAWGEYALAELEFVRGDWDGSRSHCLAALAIAEPNAYHRPVVRTLMVLTAVALARGETGLLSDWLGWVERMRSTFPDSPFGRFMHSAMDLRFAAAGLLPPFTPGDDLLDAWDEGPGLPSWQAATWTNVGAWIDGGRLETAAEALVRIDRWQADPMATDLAGGVADALRARLGLARGEARDAAASAERAAATMRRLEVPWGVALAERVRARALRAAGRGADVNRAEAAARAAERRLGIPNPGGATSGRRRSASRGSVRSGRR